MNKYKIYILEIFLIFFFTSSLRSNIIFAPQKDTIKSGNFTINIIKNNQINFIHAELIILFQTKDVDSVIPFLTAKTLFSKSIFSKTQISKLLKNLGSDYSIEFFADHLVFKINFLKKHYSKFFKFLAALYNSNSLSKKVFKLIKKNTIEDYDNNRNFQIKMGVFAAYKSLFKNQILGNNFFTIEDIKNTDINQLIVHYKGTYKPKNSILYLTGKISTEITMGYVSNMKRKTKKSYNIFSKNQKPIIHKMFRPIVLNHQKIINPILLYIKIINIDENENKYQTNLIINETLFKQNLMRRVNDKFFNLGIKRDAFLRKKIFYHRNLAVIINPIKLTYPTIPKFIFLLNRELKRIKINPINRKMYKRVFSFLYGRNKINTMNYFNSIKNEIKMFFFNKNFTTRKNNININRNLYVSVNNVLNTYKGNLFKSGNSFSKNETLVIIGNYNKIIRYFPSIDADIINYKK